MKNIFRHISTFVAVAIVASFTACNLEEPDGPSDIGLGIKVFAPTKVVEGVPMTINGSGFLNATEIVFPDGISVKDFELVSNEMIRVNAPSGISAMGGQITVRTADDEVVSEESLTVGHTVISGYSKQEGEEIEGGDLLTIFGTDLEFINSVELIDKDGNPLVIPHELFYRKGTSTVIIMIPKTNIFEGTFAGKVFTFDGKEFTMPELSYKPQSGGGHWETQEIVIWENPGAGAVSWSGTYRYAMDGMDGNNECIATFPESTWQRLKTETFYVLLEATDPQLRVTDGWWSTTWTGGDIQPGNEHLTDNGDGTFTAEINLVGDPLLDVIDSQHLLLTGDRFTPVKIFFTEEVWVGDGHWETVKTSLYKGNDDKVSWSGKYRFAMDGHDGNNECCATFPEDVWNKLKTETFYIDVTQIDPPGAGPQIRVTDGWWSTTWTGGDIQPGNELLTDNGNGTYTLEVNLAGDPLLDVMDSQHLLITGDRFMLTEIYFTEEVWVEGGGDEPEEVVFWENTGTGEISWDSTYRFAADGHSTGEEIAVIPADAWEVIKTGTFYLTFKGGDWPQMRITTGWWSTTWTGADIDPNTGVYVDNGDGTMTLEINFAGDPILDVLDEQHLLFTGGGYTPLKLYYLK